MEKETYTLIHAWVDYEAELPLLLSKATKEALEEYYSFVSHQNEGTESLDAKRIIALNRIAGEQLHDTISILEALLAEGDSK